MKKQNKAFTLVELIVVITILAILWTIAFISLQWYSSQARDSKRLSDIQNIKKSLELFSLNTWKYPLPDTWVEYSFSWELLWTQWIVWDQVSINLSRNLNEKPLDPLSETEYVYSVTNTQTQFEILWLYESDLIWTNIGANLVFAQQSNAATQDYAKISWTYNWIYVKSPSFIFPTPSIINALNTEIDFNTNSWAIQSQVITWWDNNIWLWTWALSDLTMTYTWVINNNSSDAEKISVIETLQNFYSGTSLSSIDEIADLLSKTSDDDKKDLAEFLVLNSWVVSVSSWGGNWDAWIGWNDEYTKLLLHAENFTDSSFSAHSLTVNWDTSISSGKFGNALSFDGTDDYLSIADSENWNFWSEDFTIDFWFNANSWNMSYIYSKRTNSSTYWNMVIWTTTNGLLLRATSSSNSSWDIIDNFTLASDLDLGVWYHFALVRNNWVWKSYINGEQTSSFTNSNPINITNNPVRIGWESNTYRFNGYLDELRISKWIARRTEDFTPPSEPYSE